MSATPSLSVVARRMWNKNSRHVGFAFDGTAMAMADCECKHTSGWKSRSRTDLLLPLSSEIGRGTSDGELRNVDEIERGTSRGSAHGNGAAKATNECSTQNSGGAQHQRRMLRRRRSSVHSAFPTTLSCQKRSMIIIATGIRHAADKSDGCTCIASIAYHAAQATCPCCP